MNHSTATFPGRVAIALLVGALAACVSLAFGVSPAQALCAPTTAEGTWTNVNVNTRGLARITLKACQPIVTCKNDICTIKNDAAWSMRVYGKCSPTDCDWGTVTATQITNGRIRGFYNHGFAKRYVDFWLPTAQVAKLTVRWRTDFVDPSRTDYQRTELFKKP